jgi:acetylxylan esterase
VIVRRVAVPATVAAVALTALGVRAAPSGPVAGYTTANVPGYVSMYEYVPAKPAASPPVLVVAHYCGGNAAGMFGIASGGGLVAAADKYGFLMVFPQTSNNCWDVGSTKSLTHDGGGDTQAIVEMVKYEISHRGANANRVYATGQSSGAMMTEALLAVYPDVFKAGAEFSGVPAGCWAVNDPGGGWSQPCALGQVSYTPQQWGDLARAMYPTYSGYRPRIQLWHGTADATINYNNQLEAIKEWTNVLELSATPTSTASLTINNHDWTRQTWKDSCGFAVLDELSEKSGPHNTDASENAAYVIPFLGLDKTGPVDPVVAACPGDAGGSGAGGSGAGGSGAGGSGAGGSGAGGGGAGGTSGAGAALGSDGGAATNGTGGAAGTGRARNSSKDASAAVGSGGSSRMGGHDAATGDTASNASSGCGCALGGASSGRHAHAIEALVLAAAALVRRRRPGRVTHD